VVAVGDTVRVPPTDAVTPVAPNTELFCVMLFAALSPTDPPLELTGPFNVMSPALVRLVAVKTTSPSLDTPAAPMFSGLFATMVTPPPRF
jgi:hypothetical protein